MITAIYFLYFLYCWTIFDIVDATATHHAHNHGVLIIRTQHSSNLTDHINHD
jgi:hypothetical protein